MAKDYFTSQEVANSLRVSKRYVEDHRRAGNIGYVRLGRLYRYSQQHIDEFVEFITTQSDNDDFAA